jgi:large subunit ribosomal protein L21
MYAIVATGGKQLKVAAGDVVSVEKLDAGVGDPVKFDVIFLADEGEIVVDSDALTAATVTGEVVAHFKGE